MKNPSVEQMQVICNIQMMWDFCGIAHDTKSFNAMCDMSMIDLYNKQDSVIELYNYHVTKQTMKTFIINNLNLIFYIIGSICFLIGSLISMFKKQYYSYIVL